MKKVLLPLFIAFSITCSAQLANNDFENWTPIVDTFGLPGYIPQDTFSYLKLDHWQTSNSLTGHDSMGRKFLVNRSSSAYSGNYSVKLNTDTITIHATGLHLNVIVPGFIVNGDFKFNVVSVLFGNNGQVTPGSLIGAGAPVNGYKSKIGAYIKYLPTAGDSMLLWAVLKHQDTVIAEAKLSSTQTYSTYTYVEAEFKYSSCATPDSVVIMIASSNPNFGNLLSGGASGLKAGSVLWVDSVRLVDFTTGQTVQPIATPDQGYTFQNTPIKINVTKNDSDCTGAHLTTSLYASPNHGTAVRLTNDTFQYTPNNNYFGVDTFYYQTNDGTNASVTYVRVGIFQTSGIADYNSATLISVYPNPSNSTFTIKSEQAISSLTVLNTIGETVAVEVKKQSNNSWLLQTEGLAAGIYFLKVSSATGISTKKLIKQ